MRQVKSFMALATAQTLLGGCAQGYPPQQATAAGTGARLVRSQDRVIPCTTTNIGIANVANCGSGYSILSAATE